VYGAADLLVLPSRFDTFGNVVLEALTCGLPVVAYDTKGPRDIVVHGECGLLASTADELAAHAERILSTPRLLARMRAGAVRRAAFYDKTRILDELLADLRLESSPAGIAPISIGADGPGDEGTPRADPQCATMHLAML
jgi:glycosyltransferase involved in cell wall biosynthesis